MKLHRTATFLRAYRFLPHRAMNRAVAALTSATDPRWAVQRAVAAWIRRAAIDMGDYEAREFASLDDFFLRRLRPGARPLGADFVSPVDGNVVGTGMLEKNRPIRVKGQLLSLERLVNGRDHDLDLAAYEGGAFAVVFLTPDGYHRVHMPVDGETVDVRWIPGRYFPQNEDALEHIPRIYERNERAVVRCRDDKGGEFLLVLVGASLIGGIHLAGIERRDFASARPAKLSRGRRKGEEIGHFAFGSTVVVLLPRERAANVAVSVGERVRMGETLARHASARFAHVTEARS